MYYKSTDYSIRLNAKALIPNTADFLTLTIVSLSKLQDSPKTFFKPLN